MTTIDFISRDTVQELLEWDSLLSTIERALIDVSKKDESIIVPPRLKMNIPNHEGILLTMPGYSKGDHSLGCKIVTAFPKNSKIGMPSIFGTIFLLNPETGEPYVVLDGGHITGWRTAAVSAIATKHMYKGEQNVLTIVGAGVQGETHALAFNHLFNFREIRIWNRTRENAERLATRLPFQVKVYESLEESCKDADVICTTTYATVPYLKRSWLKSGVHINAVGAGNNHYSELEEEIYRNAYITVEHHESAGNELRGLLENGIEIKCEVGEFISNGFKIPQGTQCSVFQSMGLAIEDVTAANLVYKRFLEKKSSSK